jgi:excinuclease ABC subunit C
MFDIDEQLKLLPEKPGVYIMKDKYGEIIYVGKAISLKNRVRQYFQNSKNHGAKVSAMVSNISEFEYIVTDSELEALILECNLIKKHRPKYNILLKDDKQYPYIKVTLNENYPRVLFTRRIEKDKAKYYGPYSSSFAIRETIDIIKKLFPVRTCNRVIGKNTKDRPCLNYYIGRCLAPCMGNVDEEEYNGMIKDICTFLSGKHADLILELEQKMNEASENLEYEKAADYRDKINSIKKIQETQKVLSSNMEDEDVIGFARTQDKTCVQIFFIRGGKLVGREHFIIVDDESSINYILNQFVKQFYSGTVFIPKSIFIQDNIDEKDIIEKWLSGRKGSNVSIKVPVKGEKRKLILMASENAEMTLKNFSEKLIKEKEMSTGAVESLADILGLDSVPNRIEAYDISNIQGVDPVGSMVAFIDGKAKNSEYRRFKIKTVIGANDYASMQEVVRRRFNHGFDEIKRLQEKQIDMDSLKFSSFPDLILVDGGLGHVNSVSETLKELGIDIPICGMVKDDRHRTRGLIYDNHELSIEQNSSEFKLITRIQDEAHRFAISYHRSLRGKGLTVSLLDKIDGIGKGRKRALIKEFGSIDRIREATIEELQNIQGMNRKSAESVYNFFHKNK